jgi:hypothetical protein
LAEIGTVWSEAHLLWTFTLNSRGDLAHAAASPGENSKLSWIPHPTYSCKCAQSYPGSGDNLHQQQLEMLQCMSDTLDLPFRHWCTGRWRDNKQIAKLAFCQCYGPGSLVYLGVDLIDSVAQEADQGIADIVEGQALEGRSTEILTHIFENWAIIS